MSTKLTAKEAIMLWNLYVVASDNDFCTLDQACVVRTRSDVGVLGSLAKKGYVMCEARNGGSHDRYNGVDLTSAGVDAMRAHNAAYAAAVAAQGGAA